MLQTLQPRGPNAQTDNRSADMEQKFTIVFKMMVTGCDKSMCSAVFTRQGKQKKLKIGYQQA